MLSSNDLTCPFCGQEVKKIGIAVISPIDDLCVETVTQIFQCQKCKKDFTTGFY